MMSSNAITLLLLFLNISLFPSISALNQEGLSLLSWLSTLNSSSSSSSSSSSFQFSSWNPTDRNPCKWDCITCTGNGFVSEIVIISTYIATAFPVQVLSFKYLTRLVLSNCNLTGQIPSSIGNLSSSLVDLDLSFNALSGTIPTEIGQLSGLQVLTLNSNFLHGEIPKEIGNCSRLKQLELFDNQFIGSIPEEIGLLVSLETFRAGGNSGIYGEIPMQISNCRGLVFLGLADTGVSGQIPSSIGELNHLKTLSIYTANLTGTIPEEIGNCSALENLFLYENQLSGNIPEELGSLSNLKRLLLWQNNLTGFVPFGLGNCLALTVIDLSMNSLVGEIPGSFANLVALEELLLSENYISGEIPSFLGDLSFLKQLELDNNEFSGEIPIEIGRLKELLLFFAWQNQLHGSIPRELANCDKLQALDLSHNSLTGSVPYSLFHIRNLSQLLLLSNGLSGEIPSDIGNCIGLSRLRLGSNNFTGKIPSSIGLLHNLTFLELSDNQFSGEIPPEIGNCAQLEMLDLHDNRLDGFIPTSIEFLVRLNVLDLSMNLLSGTIPDNLGKMTSLNKLIIRGNSITGLIPKSFGFCKDLQLLDISSNRIIGPIPDEIGQLQGLDILLNFSRNQLTGPIPGSFANLSKLANLDLSHNMLTGDLTVLGVIDNLVYLDVSYNNFSGLLPDTKFFHELSPAGYAGNPELCITRNECQTRANRPKMETTRSAVVFSILGVLVTFLIVLVGVHLYLKIHNSGFKRRNCEEEDSNMLEWDFTPFQKLNFSADDVVTRLSDANIIGKGVSGMVYRVETPTKQVIAVKKLWPLKKGEVPERDLFSTEVNTLGSIRHKNILRLLGCCNNGKTQLLFFDYISNGSLGGLLHEKKAFLDWDARYNIILGAAHGLAYLHHDCIPPIIHRDIKSNNILVGPQFEAFIADFGHAKLVDSSESSRLSNTVAGSYGYIAPEYGYSFRITEKSDVYSYGVVLLEVLTGKEPTDSRIPEGAHIVNWVIKEVRERREATKIFDQQLLLRSGTQLQEMVQVLGVALLCVNSSPEERPSMKDVAAMLKEIRIESDHDIDTKPTSHCSTAGATSKENEFCLRSPS